MKRYVCGLFALSIFATQFALATTFVNRPLGDVVNESPLIVRGRTGDSYSQWDKSGRGQIFTYTSFAVSEVLKGDLKETRILLRQPGGSAGEIEMNVPGTANFKSDEDVVVLLGERNKEDDSYDVPGLATGKYDVVAGENGEPYLVNSLGGGAVYEPNKDARTMSYNSKIPLEVFRRVAKGEDVPEATHKQYERSHKAPLKGSYDDDHHKHVTPSMAPSVVPAPPEVREPVNEDRSSSLWIPISFGIFAFVAGILLWWILRKDNQ